MIFGLSGGVGGWGVGGGGGGGPAPPGGNTLIESGVGSFMGGGGKRDN